MSHKVLKWVGNTIVLSAIVMVLYVGYLLTEDPKDVFTINGVMMVDKKEYHVGDVVSYMFQYCKGKNYEVIESQKVLEDGYSILLPNNVDNLSFPVGCYTGVGTAPLVVPDDIPKGHNYRVVLNITYRINPFKTKTVKFETEEFKIIK